MSVHVKWFATLAKRTKSKQPTTEVDYRDGLTPFDIFEAEGFSKVDAEAVVVLVNDAQSSMDAPLADGDRVEFLVSIQGGAGTRP